MIELFMVVAYFIITTAAGKIMNGKGDNSIQHFFVAKKHLGIGLTVALMFGEMVAGSSTVGNAASAFKMGLSSVWTNWGMVLGVLVFVFCTAKFYRRAGHFGVMSVPEAFAFRFDKRVRLVVLVIIMFVYGIIFSQQPIAAAALLSSMLGVNKAVLAWIVGILFAYMALHGLKGIAGMNVIHSLVMFAGMFVVSFLAVGKAGGLAYMMANTPAHYFTVTYPDKITVAAQVLGAAFSMILSSTVVNCCLGAESLKTAKSGIVWSGILVIPFALMPALIGIAGFVTMPDAQAGNIIYTMAESVHPVFSGIVSMAVLAAILSTGPGLLLSLSATLTRDFYMLVRPQASEKEQIRFSKGSIVVMALVATGFGLTTSSILTQILGAFQIRSVAGVVLIIALVWKQVSNRAAFWSILIGGILAGVWHFSGNPFGIQPFWAAVPASVVILTVLTMLKKEKISPDYLAYYNKIKDVSEIKDGDIIAIPNDATNGGRALKLLESAGLIKVDPEAGYTPTKKDITENPLNLDIKEVEAANTASLLPDVAAAVINGGHAVDNGLNPEKDSIFLESVEEGSDNPYVNIIVARTADKDNELYKKVVDYFRTPEVAKVIEETYKGAYIPTWE